MLSRFSEHVMIMNMVSAVLRVQNVRSDFCTVHSLNLFVRFRL